MCIVCTVGCCVFGRFSYVPVFVVASNEKYRQCRIIIVIIVITSILTDRMARRFLLFYVYAAVFFFYFFFFSLFAHIQPLYWPKLRQTNIDYICIINCFRKPDDWVFANAIWSNTSYIFFFLVAFIIPISFAFFYVLDEASSMLMSSLLQPSSVQKINKTVVFFHIIYSMQLPIYTKWKHVNRLEEKPHTSEQSLTSFVDVFLSFISSVRV